MHGTELGRKHGIGFSFALFYLILSISEVVAF